MYNPDWHLSTFNKHGMTWKQLHKSISDYEMNTKYHCFIIVLDGFKKCVTLDGYGPSGLKPITIIDILERFESVKVFDDMAEALVFQEKKILDKLTNLKNECLTKIANEHKKLEQLAKSLP